jgi:hypothetical protein
MKKSWTGIGILLAGAALLLGSCSGGPEADPQEMQMRTYRAPEGMSARRFRDTLSGSLTTGEQKLGTASKLSDDSVLVTAPASVHEGIEDLVREMARRGAAEPEPAPATATIGYWFLLGRPREGGGVDVASPTLERDDEIRRVLDEIVGTQGGMEFELLERLQLKSLDNGTHAAIRGRRIAAEQRVMEHGGDERLADIKITIFGPRGVRHTLESRIRLEPGRHVVLGQTAFNDKGDQPSALESLGEDLMLYYVISSEID